MYIHSIVQINGIEQPQRIRLGYINRIVNGIGNSIKNRIGNRIYLRDYSSVIYSVGNRVVSL